MYLMTIGTVLGLPVVSRWLYGKSTNVSWTATGKSKGYQW